MNATYISNYTQFMMRHLKVNKATHTRIPDDKYGVRGGAFTIQPAELPEFYDVYKKYVLLGKNAEYLTEVQLADGGPLLVDFDFHYPIEVTERKHDSNFIEELVYMHLEEISRIFDVTDEDFPVFVLERSAPYQKASENITKDGIHIVFGIAMTRKTIIHIRERICRSAMFVEMVKELGVINPPDKIYDDTIAFGTTNWQMYGSRKPGLEPYVLTHYYRVSFSSDEDNAGVNTGESGEGECECEGGAPDEASIATGTTGITGVTSVNFLGSSKEKKPFIKVLDPSTFDAIRNFPMLSAQYNNHVSYPMKSNMDELIHNATYTRSGRGRTPVNGRNTPGGDVASVIAEDVENVYTNVALNGELLVNTIRCKAELEAAVNFMIKSLKPSEYFIRETHEYTQILPEKYYEPGSHLQNRMVAFALKLTSERLFLSWIMLRSKASDFDYSTIPALYHDWTYTFNKNITDGIAHTVTRRSIIYWAKQDAFEDYLRIKNNTVDHYIEAALIDATEFDIATVLLHLFKDNYVYTSDKTWYMFKNHRWEEDNGGRLRHAISKELYYAFRAKHYQYMNEMDALEHRSKKSNGSNDNGGNENNDGSGANSAATAAAGNAEGNAANEQPQNSTEAESLEEVRKKTLKKRIEKIGAVCVRLKKTADKNNILREAAELFYDGDFIKSMDANPHLMCFKNGVFDFKAKMFRPGYPQDYITKQTTCNYVSIKTIIENNLYEEERKNIDVFMTRIFPLESVREFMWDHLASSLIGEKKHEMFAIYVGTGANGKTMITTLMERWMGLVDGYYGVMPVKVLTDERGSIGQTSSELVKLRGARYVPSQEPRKGEIFNEGLLKELVSCEPITVRELYKKSETFIPQWSLALCTNNIPEVRSNDDGTWRRMRIVNFIAKFADKTETFTDDTPYVYEKDNALKEKLVEWSVPFAAMLVERACQTEGYVRDCDEVLEATNKFRKSQDIMTRFIDEKIVVAEDPNRCLSKKKLTETFKAWYEDDTGSPKGMPKIGDLEEIMNKKFGHKTVRGWNGIYVRSDIVDVDGDGTEGGDESQSAISGITDPSMGSRNSKASR